MLKRLWISLLQTIQAIDTTAFSGADPKRAQRVVAPGIAGERNALRVSVQFCQCGLRTEAALQQA